MVTFFNLSFTFFFEHFLQETMGLMYRMVFVYLIFTFFFRLMIVGLSDPLVRWSADPLIR